MGMQRNETVAAIWHMDLRQPFTYATPFATLYRGECAVGISVSMPHAVREFKENRF
jgi:hypothetical protein